MTKHRLTDYLDHIRVAIDRILEYTAGLDQDAFARDARTQDAVIRNIEIIGEASNRIRTKHPEFARTHPDLPFAAAYQMRNAVATATSKSTSASSGRPSGATFPGSAT